MAHRDCDSIPNGGTKEMFCCDSASRCFLAFTWDMATSAADPSAANELLLQVRIATEPCPEEAPAVIAEIDDATRRTCSRMRRVTDLR